MRMATRIIPVIFVVVFLFLSKTEGLEDIIPVENEIGRLLIKLRGVGDESLVEAQTTLDEAQAKLNKVAGKTETAAAQGIQGTENELKGELDALKEKAKKAGVNIDDCLGEDERKLNNLLIDFSRDMVQCVENTINEGNKYAQDALEKMEQTINDAENIKQELNDCGRMWISETCLEKLAKKLEREVESLPTQIKADAVATAALISQLNKKIEKCASDKTDVWEAKGKGLLKTIEVCIARKIITRN